MPNSVALSQDRALPTQQVLRQADSGQAQCKRFPALLRLISAAQPAGPARNAL